MQRRRHLLPSLLVAVASTLLASAADAKIIATQKKTTPRPGVTLLEGTTRAPKSTYHAAKISLCHEGVRVDATPPATSFKTVPAYAKASGADLAVNGDFYKPGPRVQGIAVGGGKPWPLTKTGVDPAVASEWYHERFGWIAFGPDFVTFTHTEHVKKRAAQLGVTQGYSPTKVTHDFPKGTVALVSGFPELVTEGEVYTCASPAAAGCFPDRGDMRERHPRTAMGLSKDMRTFILVVVDGRSSASAGMYGTELAELMSELGAWQAFNLDGGGSSEMWLKGRGTINAPSGGSSRSVANHWGVFTGEGEAAHCLPMTSEPSGGSSRAAGGEDELVSTPENPDARGEPGLDVEDAPPNTADPEAAAAESGCSATPRAPAHAGGVAAALAVLLVARGSSRRRR